jgi:hypothetical protein
MNKILCLLVFMVSCINIDARVLQAFNYQRSARDISENPLYDQKNSDSLNKPKIPSVYLGLGLEVNNYGFGLGLEVPISKKFSITGNVGLGGWGWKIGGSINYYFKEVSKKSELSLGYSYASGLKDFETDLYVEPNNIKQKVRLDLNIIHTINIMYTYNLKLGKSSKIGFCCGAAISLTKTPYTLKTQGVTLSSASKQTLQITEPGGLIIGIRFMFGIR